MVKQKWFNKSGGSNFCVKHRQTCYQGLEHQGQGLGPQGQGQGLELQGPRT